MSDEVDEFLAHFGVKGMKWGVTKGHESYREAAFKASPGGTKVQVTAKNGDKLTVEKTPLGGMAVAFSRMIRRDPADNVSNMSVRDASGKEVGSFQVWREGKSTVRGEWLEIKSSHQGRGYSEAAIKGLMKAAEKDPSLKEVRLQVPSNAAPAKHIYSKLGFEKDVDLGVVPGYGNLEDWVYKT